MLEKLEQKLEEVSTICPCRMLHVQRSQFPHCPALQYVSKLHTADQTAATLQKERDDAVQVV